MKKSSFSSLLGRSADLIWQHAGVFIKSSIAVVLAAIMGIGLVLGVFKGLHFICVMSPFVKWSLIFASFRLIISIISLLGFALLCMWMLSGWQRMTLNAVEGKDISVSTVFSQSLSMAVRMFALITLFSVIIGLGFLALIIPGIFAFVRLNWAIFILVDQNCGVIEALYKSYELTDGYGWQIFLLLTISGIVPAVGIFITPFVTMLLYKKLNNSSQQIQDVLVEQEQEEV